MFKKRQRDDSKPGRRQSTTAEQRPDPEELASRYSFRRNRTLTGSSSARVTSSVELNAELRSPRAHVHHLSAIRRRLLLYFLGVGAAALGLYLLISQLVATAVVSIQTLPPLTQPDQAPYQAAIDSYYAARPAERLRFLLNEPALVSHVQSSHPEIESIIIESGAVPGEASFIMTARAPIARWSIDGSDRYVDGAGIVFERNYFEVPSLQIVDNSGLQASGTRFVASNRFLGFIGKVVSGSTESGLSVSKVTIPVLTTRQVALSLVGQTTEYRLSVDRSAGEQVEDVGRISRYLADRNLRPSYVDVRIAGKAFYR